MACFYALFRTARSPGAVVHVCDDLACQVNGAEQLCEQISVKPILSPLARTGRRAATCRVGTVREEEVLARMERAVPFGSMSAELALLDDIGSVAADASIRGLGQTAVTAVASAVRHGLIGS